MSSVSKEQKSRIIKLIHLGKDSREIANQEKVDLRTIRAMKAQVTARDALKWAKWRIRHETKEGKRWQIESFLGPEDNDATGIVDLVAIRKDHKSKITKQKPFKKGDLFEIILIQVKGGGAQNPSKDERDRLREVGKYYHAKDIILASWQRGKVPILYSLMKAGAEEGLDRFPWENCRMEEEDINKLLR